MIDFKLRRWEEKDAESLVKHANNFNIAKFLTDQFPHPYTLEQAFKFISMANSSEITNIFAIEVNDEACGGIGLHPQTDIMRLNAELGYWLSEKYWGNGIVTEAIIQTVKYGFEHLHIHRIYARPFGNNISSQKVLEKAGFKLEARLEKVIIKNNEVLDELIYAIRKI